MVTLRWVQAVVGGALMLAGLIMLISWGAFRVYVAPDKMAVLIRKTGKPMPPGQKIAEEGEKGIQRVPLGPGRYFFNPLVWEIEHHDLIEIPAGDPASWREVYAKDAPDHAIPTVLGKLPQVGIVTSLAGKPWTGSSEVVDEGFQGIQRAVLTPGTYRLNPRAYKVELVDATFIPLGCVGVVTSQLGDLPGVEVIQQSSIGPDGQIIEAQPNVVQKLALEGQRGVLAAVLPPGIYYLNPYVYKVRPVQVGYNELSQMRTAEAEEVIKFPSRDGFTIEVEVTVVWGRHPEHASQMINRFGDVAEIKNLMLSQMRSICRNLGSDYDSTDFIRGEKRELYQIEVTETLRRAARERDIDILIALIQNIEVLGGGVASSEGNDLKSTIQRGFIAVEEELTRQKQRDTARVKATLASATAQIEVAREQVRSETRKKVAETEAEGVKKARQIDAERELDVARVEREIAELDAARIRVSGAAEARVKELKNVAEAEGKRMLVQALGSGHAYNLYTFAQRFEPQDIRLIFAGEGTFWTDLARMQEVAAARLLQPSPADAPRD